MVGADGGREGRKGGGEKGPQRWSCIQRRRQRAKRFDNALLQVVRCCEVGVAKIVGWSTYLKAIFDLKEEHDHIEDLIYEQILCRWNAFNEDFKVQEKNSWIMAAGGINGPGSVEDVNLTDHCNELDQNFYAGYHEAYMDEQTDPNDPNRNAARDSNINPETALLPAGAACPHSPKLLVHVHRFQLRRTPPLLRVATRFPNCQATLPLQGRLPLSVSRGMWANHWITEMRLTALSVRQFLVSSAMAQEQMAE
ncbi:hypothetical protein BDK51DRAFT_30925 [Blyttiomyces helicus]|uniref:Uncharacterized protein n=1 Tax=Blyttiomyces helicus TaxID=388810 RepID=A0A4P9WLL1_9FUNG|nr:hypothetical protein BDK51DRAFT_30925 [Blyttiomyces helicus]|eukprot:RKO91546.1 hypothetical protein BDK51DRAFT_30925 [Blyttiomyces helicus]